MSKQKKTSKKKKPKREFSKLKRRLSHPFWAISAIALAIILIITSASTSTASVSKEEAGQRVINFAASQGATAELVEVTEEEGLYSVLIRIQGQDVPVFVTKDGKNLIPQLVPLETSLESDSASQPSTPTNQQAPSNIPKADKPVVELFVMSHCPYGTQIEKGMLPVATLLGDKIDFNIKFVYYAMHGETEVYEELNQYCIEEEQNDKYLNYLTCFLEDGNTQRCLDAVGIDQSKLSACTASADKEFSVTANFQDQSSWLSGQFPLIDFHKTDNERYNVGGSPTLVINGAQVQSQRDSNSLLAAICSSFNNSPEECATEFAPGTPSTGFGYGTAQTTNNAAVGCGY